MSIGQAIWDSLAGNLRAFGAWMIQFLLGYTNGLIAWLADMVASIWPSGFSVTDAATVKSYLAIANAWVPIDYATVLFSSYITFRMTVIFLRHVVKMIPTIG